MTRPLRLTEAANSAANAKKATQVNAVVNAICRGVNQGALTGTGPAQGTKTPKQPVIPMGVLTGKPIQVSPLSPGCTRLYAIHC